MQKDLNNPIKIFETSGVPEFRKEFDLKLKNLETVKVPYYINPGDIVYYNTGYRLSTMYIVNDERKLIHDEDGPVAEYDAIYIHSKYNKGVTNMEKKYAVILEDATFRHDCSLPVNPNDEMIIREFGEELPAGMKICISYFWDDENPKGYPWYLIIEGKVNIPMMYEDEDDEGDFCEIMYNGTFGKFKSYCNPNGKNYTVDDILMAINGNEKHLHKCDLQTQDIAPVRSDSQDHTGINKIEEALKVSAHDAKKIFEATSITFTVKVCGDEPAFEINGESIELPFGYPEDSCDGFDPQDAFEDVAKYFVNLETLYWWDREASHYCEETVKWVFEFPNLKDLYIRDCQGGFSSDSQTFKIHRIPNW
tara:strand:+ start:6203 stop:7294 length:1092 start_codon:yes stop_codon:yes gene_type:complete